MDLPILNFSIDYQPKLQNIKGSWRIYDCIRNKWLVLTPEEWVRQHCVQLFLSEGRSKSSILEEKKVEVNGQSKRLDILVLEKAEPYILVECKSYDVALTEEVFEQAARYNMIVKAKYIMLTNGMEHMYFEYDEEGNIYRAVKEIK